MTDLTEFANHVEEYARNIEGLTGTLGDLKGMASTFDVLIDDLTKSRETLPTLYDSLAKVHSSIEVLRSISTELVNKSKGVDEALAAKAEQIISDARQRGQEEVTGIRRENESTLARLKDGIARATDELKAVQSKVEGARTEHDQVLASMESLQKRLAGK